LSCNGKDPRGFAASALYLAVKFSDQRLTQKVIAKATKITEVTLRTRIKELKNKMKLFN
ncbi:MAG: hypothetical protein ACFFB6_11245, partial [Promethearchaeota archaeon]